MDRTAIATEMGAARATLHALLTTAGPVELRRRSDGTRWTNQQLLFHMVLGYAGVRVLLPLVRLMGRLPAPAGRGWAALLNAAARPFPVIDHLGPVAAARVLSTARIDALGGRVIAGLQRAGAGDRGGAAPRHADADRWDPYFTAWMSLAAVYRYATTHFATRPTCAPSIPNTARARATSRPTIRPRRAAARGGDGDDAVVRPGLSTGVMAGHGRQHRNGG